MESMIRKMKFLLLSVAVASLVAVGCSSKNNQIWEGLSFRRPSSNELFGSSAKLTAENKLPERADSIQSPSGGLKENGVALASYSQADKTRWLESLEQAQKISAETGKPILADFTGSDWCSYCVKLKDDVFESPQFQTWAAENVVLLEIDYPRHSSQASWLREQNQSLKKRFDISRYPTVLLLTAEGRTIGKLGYMNDADKWIAVADNAIRADESIAHLDREASLSAKTTR